MFDNIGGKIKTLATVICWIGIMGSIIGGLYLITESKEMMWDGILLAVGGALGSWCGSFVLYGFGELIETTNNIADNIYSLGVLAEKETLSVCKGEHKEIIEDVQTRCDEYYNTVETPTKVSSNYYCCKCGQRVEGEFCPNCGEKKRLYCEICKEECDRTTYVKMTDEFKTKHLNLCDRCLEQHSENIQNVFFVAEK